MAMRLRTLTGLVIVGLVVAAAVAPVSSAKTRMTCPSGGLSNTTIRGGLVVGPGYCLLDHVTVHGGLVVKGQVDLESSHVYGGVHLRPGGEIELGASIFGGERTVTVVHGGLHLNHPVDWDIENGVIHGGVHIRGGVDATPTFCGNTVHGAMSVRNVNTPLSWIGDPSEDILGEGGPCPGNTIMGSLLVLNSSLFHIQGNHVSGQISTRGSQTT
jgi:hypothetical protein